MKTATLRDLRNDFGKLEVWLQEGEDIAIFRRQERVAILSLPSVSSGEHEVKLPDFAKRRGRFEKRKALSRDDLSLLQSFEREGQEG